VGAKWALTCIPDLNSIIANINRGGNKIESPAGGFIEERGFAMCRSSYPLYELLNEAAGRR
jgi:hypothetical protein